MGTALSEIEALPFLFVAQPLRLDYLDRAALDAGQLAARTRVVTSGLSGEIPGGIPVGWLVTAHLDADGLYGVGEVLPAVDFAALRTMAVLVGDGVKGGAAP
jgi:cell shape-determining protein MreC